MRGQQRRRARDAADIIAFGQQRAADAAIDRRANLGIFQIELRGITRGFRGEQGSLGFLESGYARIRFLGGNRFVREQLRGASASRLAFSSCTLACSASAWRRSNSAWCQRGSITNSTSPFFTNWPD